MMFFPLLRFGCVCLATAVTTSEAFSFAGGLKTRAKAELIDRIESGAPNEAILEAVRDVEKFSILGGADLSNPLLPGNWLMVWTTSNSIAGKTRPSIFQTNTPPEQLLDVENGRAVNAETVLGIRSAVRAEISPMTKNKVQVQFLEFSVGPVSYQPEAGKFKAELSVSYLDEDMRISRGDKGNAFVLLRESTQREEANRIWKGWKQSWQ